MSVAIAAAMLDHDVERRSIDELVALVAREERTDLIERLGGLGQLARADAFEIASHLAPARNRRNTRKAALEKAGAVAAAFELGRRVAIEEARPPTRLISPEAVAAWASPRLTRLTHEELWVVGLDGRGNLRAARLVAKGGLHGASVRAADPIRAALRVEASGFVLVHNHPSGDPTPSREDIVFTEHVALAAAATAIPLLDHVVVAREGFACVELPAR
jgi:DNA repair protein RadC